MFRLRSSALTITIALTLSACGGNGDPQVAECVKQGVAYFKKVGSFPNLRSPPNAGRSAEEVARERCNENPDEFQLHAQQ